MSRTHCVLTMNHLTESVTWTPRTSKLKAGTDQLEKRRLKHSTLTSLTHKLLESSFRSRSRARVLKLKLLIIARELMIPNFSSSSGSSRSHGRKRADSLRWIKFVKTIVDSLVDENRERFSR